MITHTILNNCMIITFSRLAKMNAITSAMYHDFCIYLDEARTNDNVKVVIIQGNEECFTAGNDLEDFQKDKLSENHPVFNFLQSFSTFEKPVVAAVAGAAIGIGTTILLHCDYVVAASNSIFSLPFINLGLCPEFAASVLLPRACGHQKSSELLMLGNKFDAKRAQECNIVTKIVDAKEVLTAAQQIASELSLRPMESLLATKKLLKAPIAEQVKLAIKTELENFKRLLETKETQEIISRVL